MMVVEVELSTSPHRCYVVWASGSQPFFVAMDPSHCTPNLCGPLRFCQRFFHYWEIRFGRFLAWAMFAVLCVLHRFATERTPSQTKNKQNTLSFKIQNFRWPLKCFTDLWASVDPRLRTTGLAFAPIHASCYLLSSFLAMLAFLSQAQWISPISNAKQR